MEFTCDLVMTLPWRIVNASASWRKDPFGHVPELWKGFFSVTRSARWENLTDSLHKPEAFAGLRASGIFSHGRSSRAILRRVEVDWALLKLYSRMLTPVTPLDLSRTPIRVGLAEFWWNLAGMTDVGFTQWEWMHLGLPVLATGAESYIANGCATSAKFVCPHVLLRMRNLSRFHSGRSQALQFQFDIDALLEAAFELGRDGDATAMARFRAMMVPVLSEIRCRCCKDCAVHTSPLARTRPLPDEQFSDWQLAYRLGRGALTLQRRVLSQLSQDHPARSIVNEVVQKDGKWCVGGDQGCHSTPSHCYPYDELFESIRTERYMRIHNDGHNGYPQLRVMQIGICMGQSLASIERFFRPVGVDRIVGVDLVPEVFEFFKHKLYTLEPFDIDKIHTYRASSLVGADVSRLHRELLADERADKDIRFDIIIDDGDHIGEAMVQTFRNMFLRFLKPGGYYIIEDLNDLYNYHSTHILKDFLWQHLVPAGPDQFENMPKHLYMNTKEVALQSTPDPFFQWVHSVTLHGRTFLLVRKRVAVL